MKRLDFDTKQKMYGHNVSHSKRRTNRVWKPNLQVKTLTIDGKKVRMRVSAQAIRSLKKKGLL